MNDTKNILLAWVSSLSSIFAAIETKTWITIISAIVLPMMFFTLGKTIDVLLQIYFHHRDVRTGSGGFNTGRVLPGQNRRAKRPKAGNPVGPAPGTDPEEKQKRNL